MDTTSNVLSFGTKFRTHNVVYFQTEGVTIELGCPVSSSFLRCNIFDFFSVQNIFNILLFV